MVTIRWGPAEKVMTRGLTYEGHEVRRSVCRRFTVERRPFELPVVAVTFNLKDATTGRKFGCGSLDEASALAEELCS